MSARCNPPPGPNRGGAAIDEHLTSRAGRRSPFALYVETDAPPWVRELLNRIDEKETRLMDVQADITAAAAAIVSFGNTVAAAAADLTAVSAKISAQIAEAKSAGFDTTDLDAAVAGLPAIAATLAGAQSAVDALAPTDGSGDASTGDPSSAGDSIVGDSAPVTDPSAPVADPAAPVTDPATDGSAPAAS